MTHRLIDEKEIFNVARCINSAVAREDYLRQVCGDQATVERIRELLSNYENRSSFLESPAAHIEVALPPKTRPLAIGCQIGPYKLRELIGEGGMGTVYVAEQTAPVKRKLALKIVRPGMATKEVVARFEAERQALAMMDHPNIAKVHDGGEAETGQPYFVMELVQGLPVTEFCDAERLSAKERLILYTQVCRAVHHAHQKGIIHRDLKPSNILVAEIDGKPVPKVIDFGVAKAIGQGLTDETLYTHFSQMVGTPLYMSPEQTGLGVVDVDTRSDVYSLGVLLYELLTGTTPFDSSTLKAAGFDEMRRIIREEEPSRPSAQVSTLAAEAMSTVAKQRKSDPRKLSTTLSGELDWLVMKSLEKDRGRRYQSAGELAEDVERYLAGEAVEACPPSARYRLAKFVGRHRAALVTGSLVLAALMIGVAGTGWQAWRATAALAESRSNEENAQSNLQLADANLRLAKEAVDEWYVRFGESWLEDQPGFTDDQRELLEKAAKFYERFAEGGLATPLQLDRAETFRRLAELQHKLGQGETARSSAERAIELVTPLVDAKPNEVRPYLLLTESHLVLADQAVQEGDYVTAQKRRLDAFEDLNQTSEELRSDSDWRLARAQLLRELCYGAWQHKQFAQAAAWAEEAIQLIEALRKEFPDDEAVLESHIKVLFAATFIRHERPSPFVISYTLRPGFDEQSTNKLYGKAVKLASHWCEQNPRSVAARDTLCFISQLAQRVPTAEQEPLILRGLEAINSLVDEYPGVIAYERSRGLRIHQLSVFYHVNGRHEEELKWILRGRPKKTDIARMNLRALGPLAGNFSSEAKALDELGRQAEAVVAYESAINVLKHAVERAEIETTGWTESWHPRDENFRQSLAGQHELLADLLDRLEQPQPAAEHRAAAVQIRSRDVVQQEFNH